MFNITAKIIGKKGEAEVFRVSNAIEQKHNLEAGDAIVVPDGDEWNLKVAIVIQTNRSGMNKLVGEIGKTYPYVVDVVETARYSDMLGTAKLNEMIKE